MSSLSIISRCQKCILLGVRNRPLITLLESVNKQRHNMLLFYTPNCKLCCPSPFIIIIIMHSFADIKTLICLSFIAISLIAIAPLCSNVINIASSSLLSNSQLLLLFLAAIKDLQLALFLENLEVSYFSSGLSNITKQGTNRYLNDTIKVISKVAVISEFLS